MKNSWIIVGIIAYILIFCFCFFKLNYQDDKIDFECNGTIVIRKGELFDEYFCYLGDNLASDIQYLKTLDILTR